jgi:hypothetical protein
MNDRLQNIFGAVVPDDQQIQLKVTDDKNPDNPGPLAQFLANHSFPASYRVFLVNASGNDISKLAMQTGGFEGRVQLKTVSKNLGPLIRGQAILLGELDFEMLDFVLWYHFNISFADGVQLDASFSIHKAHSLRQDRYRACPALGKDAYHCPFVSQS